MCCQWEFMQFLWPVRVQCIVYESGEATMQTSSWVELEVPIRFAGKAVVYALIQQQAPRAAAI